MKINKVIDVSRGDKLLSEYLKDKSIRRVILSFFHGVGDCVLAIPVFKKLQELYPDIHFDLGLCKGLQEENIYPEAVLLNPDWREKFDTLGYDLVFSWNFPLEDPKNTSKTKAEVTCEKELGIEPVSGHLPINVKKIVGVHFHNTSVSWAANADENVAKKVWGEIIEAGYIPVETLMQHVFYNDTSKKYDFTDNHVRNWPARLDTLIALLGACDKFIGVVSGNWHLALSILGPKNVMLLERELKVGHFTKHKIATADIKNYVDGTVSAWLKSFENQQ